VLRDTIVVGNSIDGIKAGPREDIHFLSSRKDIEKELQKLRSGANPRGLRAENNKRR
jgi:hypothetical protein